MGRYYTPSISLAGCSLIVFELTRADPSGIPATPDARLTAGRKFAMNTGHGAAIRLEARRHADASVRDTQSCRHRADHHGVLPRHLAVPQAGPARSGVEHDGGLYPDGSDPQPEGRRLRAAGAPGGSEAVSPLVRARRRHAGDRAREDL